jgi:hypothetical protein
MVNLPRRLARIEGRLLPLPGCPTCQGWTGVVLAGEDGPHRPEFCPDCGRLAPATLVVQVVGIRIALI